MNGLRYLAGALALCIFCSASALAADLGCASRAALVDFVSQRLPQAEVTVLQKAEARVFLAAVNRIAPAAALTADEIVIVDTASDAPAVRVALFEAGCLTRVGYLPRGVVRTIMVAIARGRA
jgi:hypothetical protein